MNKELDLKKLWKVFVESWWKMLIVALVAALLAGAFTAFFIPKKYSSTVTFYIINANDSADYTTTSLLSATEQLANDYAGIIVSDVFLSPMVKNLEEQGMSFTAKELRSAITYSVATSSSLMTLRVTHTDPELAYAAADYICKNAPQAVKEIAKKTDFESTLVGQYINALDKILLQDDTMEYANVLKSMKESMQQNAKVGECIEPVNYPVVDKAADSPSVVKAVLLAAIVAVVIVYLACLIRSLINSVIVTKEELREITNAPVIGVIPHWLEKQN